MRVTVVITGIADVVANIQQLQSVITRTRKTTSWNGAQHLFARTRAVVPYLTGELYDAAYMADISTEDKSIWAVGYDTNQAPHAIIVHETPNRMHPTRGPSREPKQDHYLSEPRDSMQSSFPRTVAQDMERAISGIHWRRGERVV